MIINSSIYYNISYKLAEKKQIKICKSVLENEQIRQNLLNTHVLC